MLPTLTLLRLLLALLDLYNKLLSFLMLLDLGKL